MRHIQRTKVLAHCIAANADDLNKNYKVIRKELGAYNKELLEKKEIIILTKTDLIDAAAEKKLLKKLSKLNPDVFGVSIYDLDKVEALEGYLIEQIKNQSAVADNQ